MAVKVFTLRPSDFRESKKRCGSCTEQALKLDRREAGTFERRGHTGALD